MIGIVALDEPATAIRIASIAVIVAGVIGLNLSGTTDGAPEPARELLDAALAVIRRNGAQALTLDAVAAEAGVSKGGVLYHFASKRALIDGLVDCWLDDFAARLSGPDLSAAYVRASDLSNAGPDVRASEFGMLAALIEDPEVLAGGAGAPGGVHGTYAGRRARP